MPTDNIGFRFEVDFIDGSTVGTMLSEQNFSFEEKGDERLAITFDTSHLAPGKYRAKLIVYASDSFGNELYIDGIISALYFQIDDTISENNKLIWLHQYWGHTHYHDLKISRIGD